MAKSERRPREGFSRDTTGFRGRRLEELFREELNSVLDFEINDPRLADIRITSVELSRDGARARVFFHSRRELAPLETVHAFERATGFLRRRLCDALPLKRTPELRFVPDAMALVEHEA